MDADTLKRIAEGALKRERTNTVQMPNYDEAQLARAVIALLKYVSHDDECSSNTRDEDGERDPCSCGIDAALKELGA